MKPPYESSFGSDRKYYIDGPDYGGQCGYHGGVLNPQYRWDDEELTERIAELMNIAYRKGYEKAQFDIRKTLGIKE